MKFATFCLLASCAIQKICAIDPKDQKESEENNNLELPNDKDTYIYEMTATLFNVQSQLVNALEQVKPTKGVTVCFHDADTTMSNHNNARVEECRKCHSKSVENNNIQKAKKCCDKVIAETKKEINADLAAGVACIKKCAEPGAKCPEKPTVAFKHLKPAPDTDESKKSKNPNTEESKTKNV